MKLNCGHPSVLVRQQHKHNTNYDLIIPKLFTICKSVGLLTGTPLQASLCCLCRGFRWLTLACSLVHISFSQSSGCPKISWKRPSSISRSGLGPSWPAENPNFAALPVAYFTWSCINATSGLITMKSGFVVGFICGGESWYINPFPNPVRSNANTSFPDK